MNKGSTVSNGAVSPARVSGSHAACGQMSEEVSNANHASHRTENGDCEATQRPRPAIRHSSQETREGPSSPVSISSVTPSAPQRRWSADFSKSGTPPVIIVRKKKKEPQPPQRGVSLLAPHTASERSFKRYSCPPVGIFSSPSRSSSSSSSSSTSSSCSSPPTMQTSVITGRDPLGWRLRPKSRSTSPWARTNRLSLQIPLPVVFPDPKSGPGSTSKSDNTFNQDPCPKTKPPVRPKPSRRHSDSSAFLGSLVSPLPAMTLQELCAVNLRPATGSDESDDVFGEANGEQAEVAAQRSKNRPPPVPEKTSMARAIAQLIAHSPQRCTSVTTKSTEGDTSTRVMKPKHSHQAEDYSDQRAPKSTGLRLDTRTSPRFPRREI
ncbi:putative protein TPRXL [Scophthalmus maximus]|uniref:putative protein TPRXL n=1 Tax=Scophthalmus maximus TaxID=52904 RepID=UPI001FA86080|nr:putative protein TPRXL [Scophthalmus maximus]